MCFAWKRKNGRCGATSPIQVSVLSSFSSSFHTYGAKPWRTGTFWRVLPKIVELEEATLLFTIDFIGAIALSVQGTPSVLVRVRPTPVTEAHLDSQRTKNPLGDCSSEPASTEASGTGSPPTDSIWPCSPSGRMVEARGKGTAISGRSLKAIPGLPHEQWFRGGSYEQIGHQSGSPKLR